MKNNFILTGLNLIVFIFCYQPCFCQVNEDSVLLANSEKWNVKPNKGVFGLAKPDFGPYKTLEVKKLDSANTKKKTKGESYSSVEFSRKGTDFNIGRKLTIEKTKYYNLSLGTASNTAEAVFAISSVSYEKRQTFLGKMLSKNDEGKNAILDYKRDVSGTIGKGIDSLSWKFFIYNFRSGGRQTASQFSPSASISDLYLKNKQDSLYMERSSSYLGDIVLVNQKGEHLAAIGFKKNRPDIWIRNDIEKDYQKAIAALFAVILSLKDF
jgi:hypothetical protein